LHMQSFQQLFLTSYLFVGNNEAYGIEPILLVFQNAVHLLR
jgi:hypothetical protein